MKPLEVQVQMEDEEEYEEDPDRIPKTKPLLQRMAEDKRNYFDRGSLSGKKTKTNKLLLIYYLLTLLKFCFYLTMGHAGSAYFMVQLPDGTMERRQKMPLNVDPGVHSSFHLDQLVPGNALTPVPTLPTITEAKTVESVSGGSSGIYSSSAGGDKKDQDETSSNSNPLPTIPEPIPESPEERESPDGDLPMSMSIPIPRRGPRRNSEGVVSSSSPSSNQGTPSSSYKVKHNEINYGYFVTLVLMSVFV